MPEQAFTWSARSTKPSKGWEEDGLRPASTGQRKEFRWRRSSVDVVSAEESIFSGEAKFVALPGELGEPGSTRVTRPLITRIKAGAVRIEMADGGEEFVFVAGGIPRCSRTASRSCPIPPCGARIWTKANTARQGGRGRGAMPGRQLDIARSPNWR